MIIIFLLLLYLQQSGHALKLIAPSSYNAMMGEDVNIPCSFTVDNPPIDLQFLAISWIFQGKGILRVQNTNVESTDPRMSYTGRAEDGIANLSIANITITDGGIYKCSVLYTPKKEEKEVRLEIQAQPKINITDKLVIKNKASTLRGVISGFYPVDIDVKWFRDGEILDNNSMEKPQRSPDGTYSVRSSVTTIPTEEDRERNFSCRVQHESLSTPLQEDFHLVYGDIPSVKITSQAFKLNEEQVLVCSASEFYPESITVNWLLNGTLVKNARTQRISSSAVESVCPFIPTEQNSGMELSCVVEHATLTTPHVERLLVQAKDLRANYKTPVVFAAVVLVLLLGAGTFVILMKQQRKKSLPKVRDITRSSGAMFSIDVDHFSPENIIIHWEVIQPPSSTQSRQIGSNMVMHQNQDGTFNAISTCESLRGVIQEDEPYTVRAKVEHQKLKHPKYKEWRSDEKDNKDFYAQPEVEMIQVPKLLINKQIQMQCRISDFYPDELTVDWFMEINGKEIPINNDDKYKILNTKSEQLPDKTFTNTAIVEFTPTLEDAGSEVVCRVSHPSLKKAKEMRSGPLQVLANPNVRQPIQLPINDSGDMVATFSLESFYPEHIKVTWTYEPDQEKKSSEEKVNENPDGTFTVTSQCTIPGNLFENPQFRVRVTWQHPSMENPNYREISVRDPDFPWHPKIEDISGSILQENQETTMKCKVSGYFAKSLRVTWLEKKGESVTDCTQSKEMPDIQHERMSDNSYQCFPSISFTPVSGNEDVQFICRVEHPSMEHPIEQIIRPSVNVPPKLNGVMFTFCESDKVRCCLSLIKFYPQTISITWSHGGQNATTLPSTKKITQTDDENTADAESECIVPWEYFKSSVLVTWTHPSLEQPGSKTLHLKDLPWRPRIEHLQSSDFIHGEESKIQCKISGYFPDELTVSWYKEGKSYKVTDGNEIKYKTEVSESQRNPDNTYSCTASLLFTPTQEEDQRSEFICSVQHPSKERATTRSTGPICVEDRPSIGTKVVQFMENLAGNNGC